MGSYATTTSFADLLPGFFKSDSTSTDTRGTAIVSAHILRAESLVNAAVSARYSLPITPVPPLLRTLAEDITCYYCMRGVLSQDGKEKNQYLAEFKSAQETLEDIREGEIILTYTDGSAVPTASTNRWLTSSDGYTPIFGNDDATQWERDQDEVDDQEAAREDA